jgi:hypothetical protein
MFIYDRSYEYILFYMYLYVVVSFMSMFYSICCCIFNRRSACRMGPRVPFALLPFGHYPIKYLKQNKKQIFHVICKQRV